MYSVWPSTLAILSPTGFGIAVAVSFGKGARFEVLVPGQAWRRLE